MRLRYPPASASAGLGIRWPRLRRHPGLAGTRASPAPRRHPAGGGVRAAPSQAKRASAAPPKSTRTASPGAPNRHALIHVISAPGDAVLVDFGGAAEIGRAHV